MAATIFDVFFYIEESGAACGLLQTASAHIDRQGSENVPKVGGMLWGRIKISTPKLLIIIPSSIEFGNISRPTIQNRCRYPMRPKSQALKQNISENSLLRRWGLALNIGRR